MSSDAVTPRVGCMGPARVAVAAGILFMPGLLAGQVPTEPGLSERTLLPRAEIDQQIAESRFRLGSVHLTPVLAITQATYENNVTGTPENPVGDFIATVSAGVGLILPAGKNVFLRVGAFPSYTWYADLSERSFWGGKYGADFLAFMNRLTIGGGASYSKTDVVFSTENQTHVTLELSTARFDAEYRLLQRLYLYGEGQLQRFRYTGPGAGSVAGSPFTTDHTTGLYRGEVRYRWTEYLRISAGYQGTQADFVYVPQQYDNKTRSVIGGVYYDRGKLFVNASGGYTEGTPNHGSTIPPFSGFLGSGSVTYSLLRRLDLQGYGGRSISYGTSSPYYVLTRYGGGVVVTVGWRLSLRGFGYLGTDSYSTPTEVPEVGLVDRVDDVTGYGGGLTFLFSPRVQLRFVASQSRYNSNVPGFDRSYYRWAVSLGVGENLLK